MIRNELCAIAEMAVPTFNTQRSRGHLPFDLKKAEAMDGNNRKWVRYSIFEAARLIAALQLTANQGIIWSQACEILRADNILCGVGEQPFETPGIHVARAEFLTKFGEVPSFRKDAFTCYQGKIEAIGDTLSREVAAYNARPNVEPMELVSLVSVNLSSAFKIAFWRAKHLGIDLGKDAQIEADT